MHPGYNKKESDSNPVLFSCRFSSGRVSSYIEQRGEQAVKCRLDRHHRHHRLLVWPSSFHRPRGILVGSPSGSSFFLVGYRNDDNDGNQEEAYDHVIRAIFGLFPNPLDSLCGTFNSLISPCRTFCYVID